MARAYFKIPQGYKHAGKIGRIVRISADTVRVAVTIPPTRTGRCDWYVNIKRADTWLASARDADNATEFTP